MESKAELQIPHQLNLQQKKLDLVLAIDHIRDTVAEPTAMLAAIVNLLTHWFQADLCLVALADRETGELELKAINGRSQQFNQLGPILTRELAEQASQLDTLAIWPAQEFLSDLSPQDPLRALQLAAVPIIMGTAEHLGALLLGRSQPHFSSADIELLKLAESQLDSAVIQGYTHYELQQHVKELETVYRIDRIRDQHLPFDDMLNAIIQELRTVIEAEMGFVMLYDRSERRLELRASTHNDLFRMSSSFEIIDEFANESLRQAELICHNNGSDVIRSIMCLPLILRGEVIGVLGVVNRYGPRGFDAEDRRLLRAIGSQMDTAIFESLEQRRLRQVLGRSVDPRVMERLLANPDVDFLRGERSTLSVLFADIRGSTRLAEQTEPELLVGFINHYLGQMTDIILGYEGTLDKFIGDGVMALFGAPFPVTDHALRAVRVGLAMQAAHQTVMEIWRERGVQAAPIGIGIATGELIVGQMGCPQRADYTVIGRAANLGARICDAARAGQVLISQATYDLVRDAVEAVPLTGQQFKGINDHLTIYHVTGLLTR